MDRFALSLPMAISDPVPDRLLPDRLSSDRPQLPPLLARRAETGLEVVAINDSGGVKQASHLVKYDSILGTFDAEVKIVDDTHISIDDKVIEIVSSATLQLPWKDLGVQLVIEGTGVFIDTPGASKHIEAGAEKVLITAPAKGDDIPTYVIGVNADQYTHSDKIISNASCTTNGLAPSPRCSTRSSASSRAS